MHTFSGASVDIGYQLTNRGFLTNPRHSLNPPRPVVVGRPGEVGDEEIESAAVGRSVGRDSRETMENSLLIPNDLQRASDGASQCCVGGHRMGWACSRDLLDK